MDAIFQQLGLDHTFFYQLAIFCVLFFLLSRLYFKPFLSLFETRHKRTVADREAAEKLMAQAQTKFDDYKRRLTEERLNARKEYEMILAEAKKEEALLLGQAREEAKKITQTAIDAIGKQRGELKRELEGDIETLAKTVSEKLLLRKD